MVIETLFFAKTFELNIKLSLVPVLVGVVIVSFTDVSVNFIGTVYALSAVVITSMYQIVRCLYLFVFRSRLTVCC